MLKTKIKGYTVEIFKSYNGTKLFISKGGVQIYAHKVSGDALQRAVEIISEQQ